MYKTELTDRRQIELKGVGEVIVLPRCLIVEFDVHDLMSVLVNNLDDTDIVECYD